LNELIVFLKNKSDQFARDFESVLWLS
jgi:hypothetical protein